MKKLVQTLVAVFLGLVLLGLLVEEDPSLENPLVNGQGPTGQGNDLPKPSTKPAPIQLSSRALFQAYEENEIAADAAYLDKWVSVQGSVASIAKDIFDEPYVVLGPQGELFGVQCYFSKKDKASLVSLQSGTEVTIVGRVEGKMVNVILKGCKLAPNP